MGQKFSKSGSRGSQEALEPRAESPAQETFQTPDLVKELDLSVTFEDALGDTAAVDETLDFPFLQDIKTISYIKTSKVMFIMRGVSGSGKTTLAQHIQDVYPDATVCSADIFFRRTGRYQFEKNKLAQAHAFSQAMAKRDCDRNQPVVVIDNTNVKMWEMNVYVKIASEFDYVVVVVEPKTPWKFNPQLLSKKSQHGVSLDIIKKKVKDFDRGVPLYYGWFLNETDSEMVLLSGSSWLERCMEIPDFASSLKEYSQNHNIYDPMLYFTRDTFVNASGILHCTSKFCGKTAPGVKEYVSRPHVQKSVGKCFRMHIIGFVITSDTFGARVKLTEEQFPLWGQNDHEDPPVGLRTKSTLTAPSNKSSERRTTLENRTCQASFVTIAQDKTEERFQPVVGLGSRAHITIGCAPGVKPVTTGFDVMRAVQKEEEVATGKETHQSFQIPGAELRFYGGDLWVLYPDKQIVLNALFTGHY